MTSPRCLLSRFVLELIFQAMRKIHSTDGHLVLTQNCLNIRPLLVESVSLEAWWAVIVNATIFQGILNFMEVYIIVFLWFSSFKIQDGSFSAGNFMRSWSVSKVISQYTRSYETFNLTAGTKWTIRSKWSVCGASLSTLTVNQLFSFQS